MRKLVCKAVLPLLCLYSKQTRAAYIPLPDTTAIVHAIDGNISEWKIDSFETDKETQMRFAVDHDADYLFVAVKIPDQRTQLKLMTMGMNMFLDRKGKHKENTGINFPLAQSREAMRDAFANTKDATSQPDPKAMREALASRLFLLKTFGFEDREDKTQMIVDEAGISVSFDWDEGNNMYIEYLVPLRFLGKNSDLSGKTLSVGWQLNSAPAMDANAASAPTVTGTRVVAVPAGSPPPTGRTAGRSSNLSTSAGSVPRADSPAKEHIFWKNIRLASNL